jgi:hypothetical protein
MVLWVNDRFVRTSFHTAREKWYHIDMDSLEQPSGQKRERISSVSEVFKEYTEDFLRLAEKELEDVGIGAPNIEVFLKSFRAVYTEEITFAEQGQGGYFEDVDEFIDDVLRRAISRLDDRELENDLGVLWGLRAGERVERLERKQSGKSGGVIEFEKKE